MSRHACWEHALHVPNMRDATFRSILAVKLWLCVDYAGMRSVIL